MSMDLTGITNQNEYYTNHYFSSIFEENASDTISKWRSNAKESNNEIRTPWALLRESAKQFYPLHDRYVRSRFDLQTLLNIQTLADEYLKSLGYPEASPEDIAVDDTLTAPVYLEMTKANGAPLLWVILAASSDSDVGILESKAIFTRNTQSGEPNSAVNKDMLSDIPNEDLATKILFSMTESPRFIIFIGMNQIALIDRNKWNEKRYLQFELEDIFSRREETTLQAMAVLLHRESLCPEEGTALLDELDSNSQKHAAGVSQDLKYALRESIELLGNEVLYDMKTRQGVDLYSNPVDAGELTIECLRYMYRMLFVLFIEARPELGYAPVKAQSYLTGYSLESLRDIADNIREDVDEVGDGYYLHETLAKLYSLIYTGFPESEEEILKYSAEESLHDMFVISPLKAHIFDPEYTKLITNAKLRNSVMLRIVDLMSLTRASGRRNERRGRISYANLGINQLGAVYEALLSYRGFIAEEDLYEVKRAGDSFNELDVGYFVKENELSQYTEDERVRYESGENKGKLRMYKKGSFIYRLAGREREKSASYYTPEVLTKCLVKYALKELLEGKTADEILQLTICEPAMGSAAFLNEAINQLAEAYIDRKQKELGETISYEKRFTEIQKVKMYLADRNVYGIDLNPVAVELAEVSLWLNTIFEGGFVPWFSTQLINGNSLIGARRQCYRIEQAQTTVKGMRWYENAPDRLPFDTARADKGYKFGRKQIYHFLLGDPGMCSYTDKVIKSLEPDNIKKMAAWNKKFTAPIDDDDVVTLLRLSATIDELWDAQIKLRKEIEAKTQDNLSIYGHHDDAVDSHTTIRQKDKIYSELYKSEHMRNAGPYARLKFAMDYWCALWFWPIDKADLLPSRSEFLFDMSLILEGTMAAVNVKDDVKGGQLSMFPTEMEQMALDIIDTYGTNTVVDIPRLRKENPRLNLAAEIAEQNKFMHWELEFADLFAEHGGFDLVIGNPPWIKLKWEEKGLLSEYQPLFAVREFSAAEVDALREETFERINIFREYYADYTSTAATQNYLGAVSNYPAFQGMKVNLANGFLTNAFDYANNGGTMAFIHPDTPFDATNGQRIRRELYPRLKYHFHFINELRLFAEVHHNTVFSLNVYSNKSSSSFDAIFNLFDSTTIDECYDENVHYALEGMKDSSGCWNVRGNKSRILHISRKDIDLFGRLFDDNYSDNDARLPVLHTKQFLDVLRAFSNAPRRIVDYGPEISTSEMWNETSSTKNGTIKRIVRFPSDDTELIYSGSHIGNANPFFKASRRVCTKVSDFDSVDLTEIPANYRPRINYAPGNLDKYWSQIQETPWGNRYTDNYRVVGRRMLDLKGSKTVMAAIIPPRTGHLNSIHGWAFKDKSMLVLFAGLMATNVYDFFIRIEGKDNLYDDNTKYLPIHEDKYSNAIRIRALRLNCLTDAYKNLWESVWSDTYKSESCSLSGIVRSSDYSFLTKEYSSEFAFRDDFSRRAALVELDVLSAMSLGLTLNQLEVIYKLSFFAAIQQEEDTWYDTNGRIIFTNSRSLNNVGFTRSEWENGIKGAPAGKKFYRTITDDTMPGGPVERTIEYVAPFARCDRKKDYETAWKFFEEKYGHVSSEPSVGKAEKKEVAKQALAASPEPLKDQKECETKIDTKPPIPNPVDKIQKATNDSSKKTGSGDTMVSQDKPPVHSPVKDEKALEEKTDNTVYHVRFGKGKIIEKYMSGKDKVLKIRFSDGEHSIMASSFENGKLSRKPFES